MDVKEQKRIELLKLTEAVYFSFPWKHTIDPPFYWYNVCMNIKRMTSDDEG